jgi:hypothetical protein
MDSHIDTDTLLAKITNHIKKYSIRGKALADIADIVKYHLQSDKRAMSRRDIHCTQRLKYHNEFIDIDMNIAGLMKCLWLCDINTIQSCENNNPQNYVWIAFDGVFDLFKFKEILFLGIDENHEIKIRALDKKYYEKDSWKWEMMCDTATKQYSPKSTPKIRDPAKSKMTMCNSCHIYEEDPPRMVVEIFHAYSVRFPMKDYQWVLSQFQAYIIKHNCEIPEIPGEEFLKELHEEGCDCSEEHEEHSH